MSQYEDYFFSQEERENQSFMLASPFYHQNSLQSVGYPFEGCYFQKEVPPTEEVPESNQKLQEFTNIVKQTGQCHQEQKIRKINIIETDEVMLLLRKNTYKGLKNDTTQIGTNLKTILVSYFRQLSMTKQFGDSQKKALHDFNNQGFSLVSLKKLIKQRKIREKGIKLINSPKILELILKSHSHLENKLSLIKYIKSAELNFTREGITKWKNEDFFK